MINIRRVLLVLLSVLSVSVYAKTVRTTDFSIPLEVRKQMIGVSWQKGCPVPLKDLAYLTLPYWGYDNKIHVGHMIIHKNLAQETLEIFKQLYQARFLIKEMKPYSSYSVGEYASHNNTVGFYCRPMQNNEKHFSWHSYGIAIDINPYTNPYVYQGSVWPDGASQHLHRDSDSTGLVTLESAAFKVFTSHGWQWGGLWKNSKDYMHFQKIYGHLYAVEKLRYLPPKERIKGLSMGK